MSELKRVSWLPAALDGDAPPPAFARAIAALAERKASARAARLAGEAPEAWLAAELGRDGGDAAARTAWVEAGLERALAGWGQAIDLIPADEASWRGGLQRAGIAAMSNAVANVVSAAAWPADEPPAMVEPVAPRAIDADLRARLAAAAVAGARGGAVLQGARLAAAAPVAVACVADRVCDAAALGLALDALEAGMDEARPALQLDHALACLATIAAASASAEEAADAIDVAFGVEAVGAGMLVGRGVYAVLGPDRHARAAAGLQLFLDGSSQLLHGMRRQAKEAGTALADFFSGL